jgi:uncharacterized protein YycO
MSQKAGTIGLVKTNGWETGLIRLGTRSHWNHVVIATGNGTFIQAQPGGVNERSEDTYDDIAWVHTQELTDTQREQIVDYCRNQIGTPYNWPAIIVFGVRTFLPWCPYTWLIMWAQNRKNVICSELAVEANCVVGIKILPGREAASISPGDLSVWVLKEWA